MWCYSPMFATGAVDIARLVHNTVGVSILLIFQRIALLAGYELMSNGLMCDGKTTG